MILTFEGEEKEEKVFEEICPQVIQHGLRPRSLPQVSKGSIKKADRFLIAGVDFACSTNDIGSREGPLALTASRKDTGSVAPITDMSQLVQVLEEELRA